MPGLNLYSNVYFHRTTRALDLHLQEIFQETMNLIFPENPLKNLNDYLNCDEWFLYNEVQSWHKIKQARKRKLAREWQKLHDREVKWKCRFLWKFPSIRFSAVRNLWCRSL